MNGLKNSADSTSLQTLTDLFPEEIGAALGAEGYRGKQIFRWLHKKRVFDFEQMSDLPKETRAALVSTFNPAQITPAERSDSHHAAGTRKVLFRLADGDTVESVYISHPKHSTLCLSTQVGCAVKCTFCATGYSGFARNLNAGEIVEQALHLVNNSDLGAKTPNIVFMGMGEPFRNYENTMKTVRLLQHRDGLGIGARKITISTAGEVEGIKKFAHEGMQVRLSVSLHAANDALRSELVPINRKYGLDALIEAIRYYMSVTGRRITFEWTLLDGVNDTDGDANELAALAADLEAKVNLIPYNPVSGLGYAAPSRKRCRAFLALMERRGIPTTLRVERGQDIHAACGQLRRQSQPAN